MNDFDPNKWRDYIIDAQSYIIHRLLATYSLELTIEEQKLIALVEEAKAKTTVTLN